MLHYNEETHLVTVKDLSVVDSKPAKYQKWTHGMILNRIDEHFHKIVNDLIMDGVGTDNIIFVRERAVIMRRHAEALILGKVVGVIDLELENICSGRSFDELPPLTVKKQVTGVGNAKKQEVSDALLQYVGQQQYKTDDESDAVAIGVAWLLKNEYEIKKRE